MEITPGQVELVHLFDKFKQIKAFVLDVDGVLTNSIILITENGELLRTMSVRDGQLLRYAIDAAFIFGVITGGRSEGVVKRLKMLGVQFVYSGAAVKMPYFEDFLEETKLNPHEVLYMGDDFPDLPILRRVGLPTCPADAIPEVLNTAAYISPIKGGEGCVRDVIEKTMRLQRKLVVE